LRYSRTSAGTTDTAADWHLGQIISTPQEIRKRRNSPKKIEGVIQSSGIRGEISTETLQNMNESNVHVCGTVIYFRDMKPRLSDHWRAEVCLIWNWDAVGGQKKSAAAEAAAL
jgi:hypothetical protein